MAHGSYILKTPAGEHIVCMMMVMVVIMVMMMTAAALLAILVMVMMLVLLIVVMMMLMFFVMVMMMAAAAFFAILVMVMMLMLLVVVMMVLVLLVVVMMMAAAAFLAILMMMVMMLMLFFHLSQQFFHHGIRLLDKLQKLCAGELIDRSGYDGGGGILLTKHLYIHLYLIRICDIGTAQDDGACVLYLVVEELTEVLHIHLAFVRVYHGNRAVQLHFQILSHVTDRVHNVAQLADA
jgi:hypothetical protein